MENTSPKKLRAKLKDYLDLAKKEVIRIKRRSGLHYILLTEEKYNDLKTELHTLQKRLLGKNHIVEKVKGKTNDKDKDKDKDKKKNKSKAKDLMKAVKKKVKVKTITKKAAKR